jgi:hypothetical protein
MEAHAAAGSREEEDEVCSVLCCGGSVERRFCTWCAYLGDGGYVCVCCVSEPCVFGGP